MFFNMLITVYLFCFTEFLENDQNDDQGSIFVLQNSPFLYHIVPAYVGSRKFRYYLDKGLFFP